MDFSRVCRTCLGTENLRPIFAQTVDDRRHSTVIFITTGVKVELNDGLPQQMCTSCMTFLNDSLKFRKQCKRSETMLLNAKCQNPYKLEFSNDVVKIEKCEIEYVQDIKYNVDVVKLEFDVDNDVPFSLNEKDINEKEKCVIRVNRESEERGNGKLHDKEKNVQRVSCPVCQKQLSSRSLRAHLATTHNDGLRCAYCKLDCTSKEALAAHSGACPRKKRRPCRTARELVKCEECGKTMQRASLRAHMAVKHKGLRPVCEHCGRAFGNKLRLVEHLRAKHGYAKLQCKHCDFTSASSLALQNHERRHRGEKPYVCEACGAKFHAAYLLAQHRHSHRTERHFQCNDCGAAFKSTNSLHAHRQARHGVTSHRCPLCDNTFSCRHYAVKHMRAAHGHEGKVPPLEVDPKPSDSTEQKVP